MTRTMCVNKSQFVPVIFEPPCTYGIKRMHLAQDVGQWQPLVNIVINIWVPLEAGNLLTT
jgi:hypothetical protein